MNPQNCCPYCSPASLTCPHLLIAIARPGEVRGGALTERLSRLWKIIVASVGDDPATDPHGEYQQTWRGLCERYASAGTLAVEGDGLTAIYLADPAGMDAVVEQCIPADEL
jgi:hypothetical protein